MSYCMLIGIYIYWGIENNILTESFCNCAILVAFYFLIKKSESTEKRIRKIAFVASCLYSSIAVGGKIIYDTNDIFIQGNSFFCILKQVLQLLALIVMFYSFFCLALQWIYYHNLKIENNLLPKKKAIFFSIWIIIFCTYIPCLLAYYPGIYSYDIVGQNLQASGIIPYNKYHPPLHTYLWELCLKFSDSIQMQPLTLYALVQMVIVSAFFSAFLMYFLKKNIKFFIGSAIYFIFNPIFAIISLIPTKDILFSVFFCGTILLLYESLCNAELLLNKYKILGFIILIVLSCLFRNNAIYAFIVCIPFMALFLKKNKKIIIKIFCYSIAICFIINGPIMKMIGVEEGNNREKLSVPMQQISLVVVENYEKINNEEIKEINKYLEYESIKKLYNPRFADPIKYTFKTDYYNKNKVSFLKLWIRLAIKYPKDYIIAFLNLNIPYWYIEADSIDKYSNRAYIETYIANDDNYKIERNSKLPKLYNFYENVASYSFFSKIPIVSNVFSIATPIWIMLFCLICLILKRKYRYLLSLLIPVLLWATYLLGPVSNFRYILPFIMMYPFLMYLILGKNDEANVNDKVEKDQMNDSYSKQIQEK